MSTLRMLVTTSRPLSWINTAYPFALAYWLLTRQVDATLVVGTLFFLVPYNLFMYGVNDVFDHESDLRNPRKGGVEGALVPRSRHRVILVAVAVSTVPTALLLAVLVGRVGAVVLAVVLFAVHAYSGPGLRFKEVPFLDSATSATHFVGPAVVGVAAAAPVAGGWARVLSVPLVCALVAFFAWSMASQAFGAVQDVVPDRAGGLRSVATVIGARATVRLAVGGYLLAAALLVVGGLVGAGMLGGGGAGGDVPVAEVARGGRAAGAGAAGRSGALLGAAPLALVYAVSILPWWDVTDSASGAAHAGWVRFLWLNYAVGFLLTMLVIAAVNGWLPA